MEAVKLEQQAEKVPGSCPVQQEHMMQAQRGQAECKEPEHVANVLQQQCYTNVIAGLSIETISHLADVLQLPTLMYELKLVRQTDVATENTGFFTIYTCPHWTKG